MRIILYTGKGGVGKTSVSAATALRCADLGHRTIVISTDAAHSLADSFDLALGPEPTLVAPNLWGQELDVRSGGELIVHIGNRKRNLILPRVLASLDVQSAKFDEDTLVITFGEDEE